MMRLLGAAQDQTYVKFSKGSNTMKTSLLIAFLIGSAPLLAQNQRPPEQHGIPTDTSRPVVSPGKAGPAGSQGVAAPPASAAINVTVAEIMARPQDYAGRNVTVTSEVEEVFTSWSLKLDEDRVLSGGIDNDMLVVGMHPLVSLGFDPSWVNKQVRVTGTVRVLQAADFRREYGRGVDDKLFRRFEGKPALIATSMSIADKAARESNRASGAGSAAGSGAAGQGGAEGAAAAKDTPAPNAGTPGRTGVIMECRPSATDCPVTESSGSSVTTTDSLPIGSTPERDDTISESQYPTSPGLGTLGSGSTGAPADPGPGPTIGIGR